MSNKFFITQINGEEADETGNILVGDGSFVEVTKAELDILIGSDLLRPGFVYKISGVHPTLYNDGTNSGTTIFLKALNPNTLAKEGYGEFWNPKYDQTKIDYNRELGIYNNSIAINVYDSTGVFKYGNIVTSDNGATASIFRYTDSSVSTSFTIEATIISGDWGGTLTSVSSNGGGSASVTSVVVPTYVIGEKVIWGGYSWMNVNGNAGLVTDMFTLNSEWTKDTFSLIDYNKVLDKIEYNYYDDLILKRSDNTQNIIGYSKEDLYEFGISIDNLIACFQWGNPTVDDYWFGSKGNRIYNSYCENINMKRASFIGNHMNNYSWVAENRFFQVKITDNTFLNGTYVGNNSFMFGDIRENHLNDTSISDFIGDGGFSISENRLDKSSLIGDMISNSTFKNVSTKKSNMRLSFKNVSLVECDFKYTTFTNNTQLVGLGGTSIKKVLFDACTIEQDLNSSTILFQNYTKTAYGRPDGTTKLRYFDDIDALVIANITD